MRQEVGRFSDIIFGLNWVIIMNVESRDPSLRGVVNLPWIFRNILISLHCMILNMTVFVYTEYTNKKLDFD